MYSLPTDTDLSAFIGCDLDVVSVGLHQVHLGFDGRRNIGISIEGDFALSPPGGPNARYSRAPEGAPALVALLGSQVTDCRVTQPGTTTVSFADGTQLSVYDSEASYESYQIHIGEILIVV